MPYGICVSSSWRCQVESHHKAGRFVLITALHPLWWNVEGDSFPNQWFENTIPNERQWHLRSWSKLIILIKTKTVSGRLIKKIKDHSCFVNIVCLFCFFQTLTNTGNVKLSFLIIAGGPPVGNGSISTASGFFTWSSCAAESYLFRKILLWKIIF